MSNPTPKKYQVKRQFACHGAIYSLSDTPVFTHEQAAEILQRDPQNPVIAEFKPAAATPPKAA